MSEREGERMRMRMNEKNFHSYSSNTVGEKPDNEIRGKFPEGFKYPSFRLAASLLLGYSHVFLIQTSDLHLEKDNSEKEKKTISAGSYYNGLICYLYLDLNYAFWETALLITYTH